jgi:hypothetical protein
MWISTTIRIEEVFMEYWNNGMMILQKRFPFITLLVGGSLPIRHRGSFPEPIFPIFHSSLAQTWYERMEFLDYVRCAITATSSHSRQVAPPDPVPVSGRGGQAKIPILRQAK